MKVYDSVLDKEIHVKAGDFLYGSLYVTWHWTYPFRRLTQRYFTIEEK